MISYIVGRNFGHLSPCMAVVQAFHKKNREKVNIFAYKTTHRWIASNLKSGRVKVKPFSREYIKKKKKRVLERSDIIFHDWREEVYYVKKCRNNKAPIIAGMFHSDLQIRKEDNKQTKKFKRQVIEMANKTTDIFFHMNIQQPHKKPNLKTKYVPIPIVARKPDMEVFKVKKKLGIPENEPFILVQMGGGTGPNKYQYMDEWYKTLNKLKTDYHIVVANQIKGVKYPFASHIRLAPIFSNGADLVNAAEMVITKPGRGIIYDCISTKKPLLLLPADTKEREVQNMMVKKLLKSKICEADKKMSNNDLKKRIQKILENKDLYEKRFSTIPTNGAEIVAKSLSLLSGSTLKHLDDNHKKILKYTPFKV